MKQYALAATAFAGTLAVLLVVFLVVEQLGASTAVADASPSPSASNLALASRTPASVRPSSSVPASTEPSATPGPTPTKSNATPRPTATPGKTIAPGTTFDVVVLGSRYVSPIVPSNGKITKLANGGIQMESDRTLSDPTEVTYKLPADQVPPGTRITRLDVAVCGSGPGRLLGDVRPGRMPRRPSTRSRNRTPTAAGTTGEVPARTRACTRSSRTHPASASTRSSTPSLRADRACLSRSLDEPTTLETP